jgi:hypothetical protein
MKNKRAAGNYSPGERVALIIFGVSSSLYILNIPIGKASIQTASGDMSFKIVDAASEGIL